MKTTTLVILLFLTLFSIETKTLDREYPESLSDSSLKNLSKEDVPKNIIEEARFYYEKGRVLHDTGEYLLAEAAFLNAIKLFENREKKEICAFSIHYLGKIESWKSNYSQSILYHKNARDLFEEFENEEYVAVSNNNISYGFYALGEYDSSIVYFKKNINNLTVGNSEETSPQDYDVFFYFKKKNKSEEAGNINRVIIESYQGLATLYAQMHNYKEAYSYLQQGIQYAEIKGSSILLADLYYTAGNLFLNNHVNKGIALEYLQKANKIFAENEYWQKLILTNLSIGKVFFYTGNDSLAMNNFRSAITKAGSNNFPALSQANHMIGMVYKSNEQYDSALVYLQKSIDLMCTACPEITIHNTLIQAADVYIKRGNSPLAFVYLTRARDIAVESNSGLEMVKSYEELANYYREVNSPDSVINYLMMAHRMANDLGLLKRIKSTAETLSNIYYSRKEYQTASDYLKLSNEMSDSLANVERYNELAKLEMRFEIEKMEEERKLEARLMQSEIAKQKLIRNTFIAGAVLFIIIALVTLREYKRKKKDNKLLAKQKSDIQEISKQLEESGKRKLDFFTNISHEIRTPLTLIKSPLERILKSGNNNEEITGQLQLVLNNTNKLKGLVNQILDLQKLDEKMLGLDLSEFEIVTVCKEIAASFEGFCYQSKCRLIFESNVNKASVRFDQLRLQAIINNLLSNAIKFNKEDGFVKFALTVSADQINLQIKDSGIGIADEHLKKLGERYYQVEKSDASIEGTGIGLAYVKELIELMKGKLDIASIEDEGTSVTISLPCDAIRIEGEKPFTMEIKPGDQVFKELEEEMSDDIENGVPRILIIEDNLELSLFLRDLFSNHYHVYLAKDGVEGKAMALKHIPDLIISDVMMPGINGNELCKILKNDINTSHITIILFTAKGSPDSVVDGYDCGADDYIVKPFDTDLLEKKVKNIIATGENARKQFSFSDMERSSTVYSEFDKKFLKNCLSEIKENLSNSNFTVELLAEKMSVHRRTLLRKFTALTGKSPADLIRHKRMSQAAELIKQKYRVNEIALMVGYEDANRFSKAFKQFFGVSPSAYK